MRTICNQCKFYQRQEATLSDGPGAIDKHLCYAPTVAIKVVDHVTGDKTLPVLCEVINTDGACPHYDVERVLSDADLSFVQSAMDNLDKLK